jgi:hypothetical protein
LPTAVAVLSSFPEFSDFSLPKLADFYFQSWLVFISKVGRFSFPKLAIKTKKRNPVDRRITIFAKANNFICAK